jgi:hypothetical protein
MKFGVREICDVVFKAKATIKIGDTTFQKGQPVLYIDTAKTSNLEAAATTVYAQGGRGNSRLIAWEGEKTLTFTVEDALLSPMGFAMLSGAGLMKGADGKEIIVHATSYATANDSGVIDLTEALGGAELDTTKPLFVLSTEQDGSLSTFMSEAYDYAEGELTPNAEAGVDVPKNATVFVDYYTKKTEGAMQFEIDSENFAGYYYVEAATLWRRQDNGKDMPAELIFPNVKIQSNFTFAMASSGDPSTFTFTMDAMPGYTVYDTKKKVLCAIQVIADSEAEAAKAVDSIKG